MLPCFINTVHLCEIQSKWNVIVKVKISVSYLISDIQGGMARNAGPGLYEFLMEAELQQYYAGIRGLLPNDINLLLLLEQKLLPLRIFSTGSLIFCVF